MTDLYLERVARRRRTSATASYVPLDVAARDDQGRRRQGRHDHRPQHGARADRLRRARRREARPGEGRWSTARRDPATYDVALAWTALTPGRTADALFALDTAHDWTEFRSARKAFRRPGPEPDLRRRRRATSATRRPGRSRSVGPRPRGPTRGSGRLRAGSASTTGRATCRSTGLPSSYNPPEGFIVTANNEVDRPARALPDVGLGLRLSGAADHGPCCRASGKVSPDDMRSIQLDKHEPFAATLVPYLLKVNLRKDPFTRQAQQLLRGLGLLDRREVGARGVLQRGLEQPAAADLRRRAVRATCGPTAATGGSRSSATCSRTRATRGGTTRARPGVIEGRDEILREALVDARAELTKSLGKDPDKWEWGQLHQLTLEHPVLGGSGDAGDRPLDVQPRPVVAARRQRHGRRDRLDGVRRVRRRLRCRRCGWSSTSATSNDSTWVNLTGESGHAYSKHYSDQTDAWAKGQTYPWPFTTTRCARRRPTS